VTAGLVLFKIYGPVLGPIIGASVAGCVLGHVWPYGCDNASWGSLCAGALCIGDSVASYG